MYTTAADPMWRCRCPPAEPAAAPLDRILDSQTHPHKLRLIAILRAVFPDQIDSWNGPEAARLMGQVEDVLAGRGALFSRQDREAIEAAAARLTEET
jgi:hypothetical protein